MSSAVAPSCGAKSGKRSGAKSNFARMPAGCEKTTPLKGQAPKFIKGTGSQIHRRSRSKTAGLKVGPRNQDGVIPTNEFSFSFFDQSPTVPVGWVVFRLWLAFGGHLVTDSGEDETRMIKLRDTVFSPLQPEPALDGD